MDSVQVSADFRFGVIAQLPGSRATPNCRPARNANGAGMSIPPGPQYCIPSADSVGQSRLISQRPQLLRPRRRLLPPVQQLPPHPRFVLLQCASFAPRPRTAAGREPSS